MLSGRNSMTEPFEVAKSYAVWWSSIRRATFIKPQQKTNIVILDILGKHKRIFGTQERRNMIAQWLTWGELCREQSQFSQKQLCANYILPTLDYTHGESSLVQPLWIESSWESTRYGNFFVLFQGYRPTMDLRWKHGMSTRQRGYLEEHGSFWIP